MSLPLALGHSTGSLADTRAGNDTPSIPELAIALRDASRGERQLAFRCIPRGGGLPFLGALEKRAANPFAIQQGDSPLCGPAAFLFCVAKSYPDVYRRYVLELALFGRARLGSLEVTPSRACRETLLDPWYTNPVDWIALASLRDSTNRVLSMSSPGASAAGITMPGVMQAWFHRSGLFSQIEDHTSLFGGESLDSLLHADRKHRQGAYVCMLVRASILGRVDGELGTKLGKDTPKTIAPTPDHWIVQTTPISLEHPDGPISLDTAVARGDMDPLELPLHFAVHSWGDGGKALAVSSRIKPMTARKFLPCFYGFVSAMPQGTGQ